MLDTLKKVMYAGVGGAAFAVDKVNEGIQELIKRGEISEKEGKELVDEYVAKVKEESSKMKEQIEEAVKSHLGDAPTASKNDIDSLKQEIEELRGRVAQLEGQKMPYND